MLAITGFVGWIDFVKPGTVGHVVVADHGEVRIAPGWAAVGGRVGA